MYFFKLWTTNTQIELKKKDKGIMPALNDHLWSFENKSWKYFLNIKYLIFRSIKK